MMLPYRKPKSPLESRVNMPTKTINPFLIIGNGRTGSTWLLTSLDLLHDVSARKEIKWEKPSFFASSNIHEIINRQSSMRKVIESLPCDDSVPTHIRGSKLIFDPDIFYCAPVFSDLAKIIEKDFKLILLKRDYLDAWLSWKVRGVYHEVNSEADLRCQHPDPMLEAIKNMVKPPSVSLTLHHGGTALSDHDGDSVAYSLMTAIDDLVQAYVNDIQGLALIRARGGMIVNYSDIKSKFGDIVRFIGSSSNTEQIEKIILSPQTRKLPSLDKYLHPIEVLREISDALDKSFLLTAEGVISPDIAWIWDSYNTGIIREPGIINAIEPFVYQAAKYYLRWVVRKPVIPDELTCVEHIKKQKRKNLYRNIVFSNALFRWKMSRDIHVFFERKVNHS